MNLSIGRRRSTIGKQRGGQVVISEQYVIDALKRGPQSLLANSIEPSSKSPEDGGASEAAADDQPPTKKSPMPRKRDSA